MKVRIDKARETTDFKGNELIRVSVYEYYLDELGPFIYRVPVTEDTQEALKAAIKAKASTIKSAPAEV